MKAWRVFRLYSAAGIITTRMLASLPFYLISSLCVGVSLLFLWTAETLEGECP